MPNKMDKELKRKFGAYLKVSVLNAKKEYLIELNEKPNPPAMLWRME